MTAPYHRHRPRPPPPQTEAAGPGARYGLGAVALAMVGMLLGWRRGCSSPGRVTPGDASPEAGFARDMSTHHQQAVAMGLIAFQQGATPTCARSASTSPPRSRASTA